MPLRPSDLESLRGAWKAIESARPWSGVQGALGNGTKRVLGNALVKLTVEGVRNAAANALAVGHLAPCNQLAIASRVSRSHPFWLNRNPFGFGTSTRRIACTAYARQYP
jgi:hypothetical protein